ncbi:pyrroline-5-carboxylate reductase [Linderina pennispora]|uniref:Pyrroline-5-carboxylate reductase n=1 Tax=Linderina pennispora TaxID=61395 RepID=A0A1Y1WAZ0_9FUNG|nr:pyrroline-5-carboxylate reductase [Linderina pennispora]ORX70693.1 pyrroline-5-carboxylate reductase [Linderina pennispora]
MAPTIVFIGGGNMCEAILSGLLKIGHPTANRAQYLREKYSIDVFESNNDAITGSVGKISTSPADVVVLAVKPQVVAGPLVISIVAGVAIADFKRWIHSSGDSSAHVPLVRLMPNTPALVGEGAAGMFANEDVSAAQKEQTEYVVKNIAKEYFWVASESGIDAVCAVSGSGPAYFFLVIEAMEKAGQDLGLPADVAKRLAAQTALGAAKMVLTSEDDVATLRRKVTSPNGTTHAAIEKMKEERVPEGVDQGMKACFARCSSLSEEFGKL